MSQPSPDEQPLPYAPVRLSRFEWPSHDTNLPVPDMGFRLRVGPRLNGDAGIFPEPAADERELARFVIAFCRAVLPADSEGRPLPPGEEGPLREVCIGGGEMILTEGRLGIVLIKASGALGKVDDERGTVITIDVPFKSVGSIALIREKRLLRGVRERRIRCYANRPAGAIDIEPIAYFSSGEARPVPIGFADAFDRMVRAACDDLLGATLMEAHERRRLQLVRDGARIVEDLDIVAEIAR